MPLYGTHHKHNILGICGRNCLKFDTNVLSYLGILWMNSVFDHVSHFVRYWLWATNLRCPDWLNTCEEELLILFPPLSYVPYSSPALLRLIITF